MTKSTALLNRVWTDISVFLGRYGKGLAVAIALAIAAQFISEHYNAPAMLMALLIGVAFHFLAEDGQCVAGINFASKTVLRIGVALLGARISVDLLADLGAPLISLVISGVLLTIGAGMLGARLLGRGWRMGFLTGGSVAICGASAAMAIAAILPRNEHSERNLIFTVLSVTVLSTIAMVIYPVLTTFFGLNDLASGVFIGGTIHDVAQVVGAGFSISETAGDTATLVKLMRVAMLAPVILVASFIIRRFADDRASSDQLKRPPLIPFFVMGFLALAAMNSAGYVSAGMSDLAGKISRWALLVAISAVGMKTALKTVLEVGGQAIFLIVAETIFLALVVLSGVLWLEV